MLIGLLLVLAIESPARLLSPLLTNLGDLYMINSVMRSEPKSRSTGDLLEWPLSLNSPCDLVKASAYLETAIAYRVDVGAYRSLGLVHAARGDVPAPIPKAPVAVDLQPEEGGPARMTPAPLGITRKICRRGRAAARLGERPQERNIRCA